MSVTPDSCTVQIQSTTTNPDKYYGPSGLVDLNTTKTAQVAFSYNFQDHNTSLLQQVQHSPFKRVHSCCLKTPRRQFLRKFSLWLHPPSIPIVASATHAYDEASSEHKSFSDQLTVNLHITNFLFTTLHKALSVSTAKPCTTVTQDDKTRECEVMCTLTLTFSAVLRFRNDVCQFRPNTWFLHNRGTPRGILMCFIIEGMKLQA